MATLAAWRAFDPLPILSSGVGRSNKGDDDSLENLLEKARAEQQTRATNQSSNQNCALEPEVA
jgi:hypothetical protein